MDTPNNKLKLAVYWGSACGGCCVSILDVHEQLFTITEHADLVFWPIALDTKYEDVEAMPDQNIDITLFNGAIRNSENEHMANLLRAKSSLLIAYGSCAHMGGIPGLANFYSKENLLNTIYKESPSTLNPNNIQPKTEVEMEEGILEIPAFFDDVRTLDQTVPVDYYIPGCPPQPENLLTVFNAVISGADLPPKGSVIGALEKTQCEQCSRTKTANKKISNFRRPQEIEDDGISCFLEQGIICLGPATRSGCGVRCISGNAPCRGCYGPLSHIVDPGAKMMSAIATMIDSNDADEIREIVNQIVDPAGTFYRFSLPGSILRKKLS
jgi:F420-non-reducing hydrogenase small subunit